MTTPFLGVLDRQQTVVGKPPTRALSKVYTTPDREYPKQGKALLDDDFGLRKAHHGRPLLDALRETLGEIDRALYHHVPLPVERHHVIAIVEHGELHRAAETARDRDCIRQVALIVVAGVEDVGRLTDYAEAPLHVAGQILELPNEAAAAPEQILNGPNRRS